MLILGIVSFYIQDEKYVVIVFHWGHKSQQKDSLIKTEDNRGYFYVNKINP